MLYYSIHRRSLEELELQWVPGPGEEDRKLVFNGDRVLVREDDKVLDMDGSDGCKTL